MKHLILPLLTASLILATLTPRANAAAIASDPSLLSPRRLGRPALTRHVAGAERVRPIKAPRLLGSSREIVPAISGNSVFGGTLDLGIGGVIKTGAGTLSLNGSNSFGGPVVQAVGTIDVNGAAITLSVEPFGISTGSLTVNSGSLLSIGVAATGAGTLNIQAGSISTLDGLWIADGAVYLVSNGANLAPLDAPPAARTDAAPAAEPVPEPGSAMLFAIGALAASQARRRHAV